MSNIVTNFDLSGENVLIQGQNNPYYGKKIAFIGDSVTAGVTLSNPNTERFSYLVCKALGAKEFNRAVSGTGFIQTAEKPTSFLKQAELIRSLGIEPDYVVVYGGINDLVHDRAPVEDIVLQQVTLFNSMATFFPSAVLVWAGFNYASTSYAGNQSGGFRIASLPYYNTLTAPVLMLQNISHNILFSDEFYSDKIHPNADGHRRLANALISGLLGGNCTKYVFNNVVDVVGSPAKMTINNTLYDSSINSFRLNLYFSLNAFECADNEYKPIFKFNKPLGNRSALYYPAPYRYVDSAVDAVKTLRIGKYRIDVDGTVNFAPLVNTTKNCSDMVFDAVIPAFAN